MTVEVQSWGTNSKAGNEDNFSSRVGDRASRSQNQEPHAKAKAAEKAAHTFRNVFEQEGSAPGY